MENEFDSITNLIKSEIKRQYKSLRKFSEESGIPYSTLSNALSKGIGFNTSDLRSFKMKNNYSVSKKIALILLALFICISFVSCGSDDDNKDSSDEFTCPDFIGRNYLDITIDSNINNKFNFSLIAQTNNDYEENIIFKQSIPANTPLKGKTNITIYFSTGKAVTVIPDIKGLPEATAIQTLELINFKTVVKTEASDTIQAGHVIKTVPAIGTEACDESIVEIYISSGKE